MDYSDLTVKERKAVERLHRLAKTWPKSLSLFSNSGSLEVHKNGGDGEPYTDESFVDNVYGITNDGGDRD